MGWIRSPAVLRCVLEQVMASVTSSVVGWKILVFVDDVFAVKSSKTYLEKISDRGLLFVLRPITKKLSFHYRYAFR
jgi:hypothetical protein